MTRVGVEVRVRAVVFAMHICEKIIALDDQ